jgi:predicted DsbA family dithiol-disulfide isomerase
MIEEPIQETMQEESQNEQPEIASVSPTSAPQPQWRIWIAAGGCAVALCATFFIGALIFAGPQITQQFIHKTVQVADKNPYSETQNNKMGNPKAPVHIIEYGDFQCPYCLKFREETEPQLIKEYVNTGKVYFEYRTYAVIGPESFSAAEGAYCAGDQNKFWEYHDMLFANWTGENVGDFTDEKLIKYAEVINLNVGQFTTCLENRDHKKTVELDMLSAEKDGVHATPSFIINGIMVEGAQSFDELQAILEHILGGNMDTQDL